MRISDIDPNFRLSSGVPADMQFHSVWEPTFQIYGIAENEKGDFCRLPRDLLPRCSEGVRGLADNLAGACVRFSTDADSAAVLWELTTGENMAHFAPSGKSGMELFEENEQGTQHVATLIPVLEDGGLCRTKQSRFVKLPGGMRSYVLYLPLYNGLKTLVMGLPPEAQLLEGRTPRVERPIVFYGSSVTQGACASKAGSCYTTLLARRLDAAQINLGFSGSARGEVEMAHYIASLNMSLFVYDYDHNAPTVEHLRATHEPFFRIIREAQPDLPVVMLSRSGGQPGAEKDARRAIIRSTYLNAVHAGDRHVWFVDGQLLFGEKDRDLCTVDVVHPTDIGFLRMADGLEPLLREILMRCEPRISCPARSIMGGRGSNRKASTRKSASK